MKIAIWVKRELDVDIDVLLRMADEEREAFGEDAGDRFAIENLLHRADNVDEVSLPSEEWYLDDEFEGTYTRKELEDL